MDWKGYPLPPRILILLKIQRISVQNLGNKEVVGKILQNKDLGETFGGWTGVLVGREVTSRERAGPVIGQSSQSV